MENDDGVVGKIDPATGKSEKVGEGEARQIVLELKGNDFSVKSNFRDVFDAVAMLERAKWVIQKAEDDAIAQARASSLVLDKMAGILPPAKRPN